jgi:hypothetical protein
MQKAANDGEEKRQGPIGFSHSALQFSREYNNLGNVFLPGYSAWIVAFFYQNANYFCIKNAIELVE